MSADIPFIRTVPGVVVDVGGGVLAVNVGGARPPVVWPAGYIPTAGDAVRVRIIDGIAEVTGVQTGPRPLTGTVSGAASGGRVPVTTVAGVLQCRYVGTAPASSTLVRLDWQSTSPWVWPGTVAAVAAPTGQDDAGPSAPPSTTTGVLNIPALTSGTWNDSSNSWSAFHGTDLTQGSYAGTDYTGAWFYGSKPQQLDGRTVTRARVRFGARRRIGSYNSSLSIQLWRHTSNHRPSGNVSLPSGPEVVSLAVNAPAQWVEFPISWAQAIVDGSGGLAISTGSYGGLDGVGDDPASGQLRIEWRR